METTGSGRRSLMKRIFLLISTFGILKPTSTSAEGRSELVTNMSSSAVDPLIEKLNDIDALSSECYSRLQDNGMLFRNIAEAKTKLSELTNNLEMCKSQAGSPDDIKAVLDDLKAIKELVSSHS